MTITSFLELVKKNLIFIASLTILGALVAYVSTSFLKPGYSSTQTYFIKVDQVVGGEENFVDINALTDTTVALISNPSFNGQVNSGATVSAKKVAPQVIEVTAVSQNMETPPEVNRSAANNFNIKIKDLIKSHNLELKETAVAENSTKNVLNNRLTTSAGALLGLVCALFVITTARLFKL